MSQKEKDLIFSLNNNQLDPDKGIDIAGHVVSWNDIPDWSKPVVKSILETVRAKDPYTFFHCCRVGRSARLLGKAAGMNEYEQVVLEYAGLLHDVGKIGIPDNILLKPAKLNTEEIHMMNMHPIKSLQIIKPLMTQNFFKDVAVGVELHHERPDGRGYPYGLSANNISELVKMISLVDSIDAMTSVRPYRKPLSDQACIDEITKNAGTQFDEQLVKIYIKSNPFFKKEIDSIKSQDQIAHSLLVAA